VHSILLQPYIAFLGTPIAVAEHWWLDRTWNELMLSSGLKA
jgi:hypothetical protein